MKSHLSASLRVVMEKNRVTGKDIARQSAQFGRLLGSSYISRILNGRQTWVGGTDLEIICRCVSASPADHAELVKAHMLDERPEFAAQLVEVTVLGGMQTPAVFGQVDPATRAALEFLAAHRETHSLLFALAKTMGMK